MTDRRRRLLFVHAATLAPLGADTWVHIQLMRTLDRARHDLTVACVAGPADEPTPTYRAVREIPDLTVVPIDLGPESQRRGELGRWRLAVRTLPAFTSAVRLGALVRRRRIDLLHTSDRPRDAALTVLLGKVTRRPSLVHVHVGHGDWMGRPLRWALRNADGLVCISEFVADTLVAAGYDRSRLHVVRNAIDVEARTPRTTRAAARVHLGLSDSAPIVLTVCRLFEEKGPGRLVEAMVEVLRHVPDAQLLVVGRELVPGYLGVLQASVADHGLEGSVSFLGWRDDVADLMTAADVYAMPSFEEPFGLVFAEAMAASLPVVAVANGGTPEVVDVGVTGLLSAAGDDAQLAADLVRLLSDPALREEMGRAGRARVEDEFRLERQAADMAGVYDRFVPPGER